MTLRGKLIVAQAPLALALIVVGVVCGLVARRLGEQFHLIVADNHRSVLAVLRMKDALEELDRAAAHTLVRPPPDQAWLQGTRQRFERDLRVQEGNVTEPGEADLTRRLRAGWTDYQQKGQAFFGAGRDARSYFSTVQPSFRLIAEICDAILGLNLDAMLRKSDRGEQRARVFEQGIVAAVVLAVILGLVAAVALTTRMLRPLGVVSAAVRRFGEGDLKARADLQGEDEIAALAGEFNRMAERLARYRASSLGELLQAQQAAQAAIDALPDPVLLLDGNGQLQGANAAAATLLHIDPEKEPAAAYAAADPGVRAVVERLRAHVLGGKGVYVPRGFEEAVRVGATPDGERIFLPRAAPIYGEGGAVAGVAEVLQDATRLFRFDELKNNLVATVAHEFRTPLTSLRMALHLCTEEVAGPLTAKQSDLLFAAREDCERLQVIVDELLNLSRIESGRIDLHRRRADPESLLDLAVEVHRAAADQAQIELRTEVLPGLPEVFVDPDRLQLVFSNLLGNALRYAPRGSPVVVRARPEGAAEARDHRLSGPSHIRFEVQDEGPGVPAEHQAGLFEKFFRVPGSPEGGSGLGLFIARGLVQAHGGKIGVDSTPGRGATFWFTIPVAPGAPGGDKDR